MAKGTRKRKDKDAAGDGVVPGSLLEIAFARYQAGDALTARKAAKRLLAAPPSPADEAAVKKIAAELLPPAPAGAEKPAAPTVQGLAEEIIERTKVPPKAYLFAALALLLFIGLVVFAATRY